MMTKTMEECYKRARTHNLNMNCTNEGRKSTKEDICMCICMYLQEYQQTQAHIYICIHVVVSLVDISAVAVCVTRKIGMQKTIVNLQRFPSTPVQETHSKCK